MSVLEIAYAQAEKRNYTNAEERRAFTMAFTYGWNGREERAPGMNVTDWPNAYYAGYWEGVSAKQRAMQ